MNQLCELLPGRSATAIGLRACRERFTKPYERRDADFDEDKWFIKHLTEFQKGYLAGIIDGEGCISFTRSNRQTKKYVYRMQLCIVNTSPQLLSWLNEIFDGHCHINVHKRQPNHKRPVWSWTISGPRRTVRFLKEIEPYLVIKKQQVHLLMNGYVHLDDVERDKLFHEVRRLKHVS
jgi:hypothetical protein